MPILRRYYMNVILPKHLGYESKGAPVEFAVLLRALVRGMAAALEKKKDLDMNSMPWQDVHKLWPGTYSREVFLTKLGKDPKAKASTIKLAPAVQQMAAELQCAAHKEADDALLATASLPADDGAKRQLAVDQQAAASALRPILKGDRTRTEGEASKGKLRK